jgi:hypothetical protein
VDKVSPHEGASAIWLDNITVLFCDHAHETVTRTNVDTQQSRSAPGRISQFCPVKREVVFSTMGSHGLAKGIHVLNVDTLQSRHLISIEAVEFLAPAMGKPYDEVRWNLGHPYLSPDGSRLLFQIKADGLANSNPDGDFTLWARADGSDIQLVGPKPMHVQWWDNDSIFGHDWQCEKDLHMRRWSLDYRILEEVAGVGCHGAVSPDRRWIATESWYGSDPIVLRLYRRGQTEETAALYVQPKKHPHGDFWKKRTHMHPAWSRDGKRLYFNAWPRESNGPQLLVADLSSLLTRGERPSTRP